mgnify:CR=1 FL=1
MRLTAFSDVSLRIMMLLSSLQEGEKLSTQKISEGVGTPYNHVAKSVAFLVNQGLLESTRGRSGDGAQSDRGAGAS